jgi:hypothetical protein
LLQHLLAQFRNQGYGFWLWQDQSLVPAPGPACASPGAPRRIAQPMLSQELAAGRQEKIFYQGGQRKALKRLVSDKRIQADPSLFL